MAADRMYADEGRPQAEPKVQRAEKDLLMWGVDLEGLVATSCEKSIFRATFTLRHIHDSWSGNSSFVYYDFGQRYYFCAAQGSQH